MAVEHDKSTHKIGHSEALVYLNKLRVEILALHREIASERLRADQGWQRYESANSDRNALRTAMVNESNCETRARLTDQEIDELNDQLCKDAVRLYEHHLAKDAK